MAKKISASVGKGGKNKAEDVKAVQEMLNEFAKSAGFKKLDEDGLIGPKTLSAIQAFQKEVVGMSRADSKVDPNSETFSTLSKGAKKVEAESKKAEKEEAEKEEAAKAAKEEEKNAKAGGEGKAQVKGETRGLDRKIMGVLEAVSAHYGKPIDIITGKMESGGSLDGEQTWSNWVGSLKRGKKDATLRSNESLRKQLDTLYEGMKHDEFVRLLSQNSRGGGGGGASAAHMAGKAFDIKRNTDSKVVAALASILRKEDEGDVIHFDDTGCNVPSTISESMKKKWK